MPVLRLLLEKWLTVAIAGIYGQWCVDYLLGHVFFPLGQISSSASKSHGCKVHGWKPSSGVFRI